MLQIFNIYGEVIYDDQCASTLIGMDLSNLDLSYADFSSKDLSGADFSFSDLSNADFSNAVIENTDFSNANLQGACFRDVQLSQALSFEGAVLDIYKMHNNWL